MQKSVLSKGNNYLSNRYLSTYLNINLNEKKTTANNFQFGNFL